jgi:hypothetical protein
LTSIYTSGEYWKQHPDWHLQDSPGKALDVVDAALAALDATDGPAFRLGDVGTGIGGVLAEVVRLLRERRPARVIEPVGFELAADAIAAARSTFPKIEFRNKPFEAADGPFAAVMFIDVLEHLENPREMLRTARQASEHMIVRQPLLESFSTFRHANYANQRDQWGHIAYFNFHSFLDMARATGWQPVQIALVPPWELHLHQGRKPSLRRLLHRLSPIMASHFTSGYYLNGLFNRTEETGS